MTGGSQVISGGFKLAAKAVLKGGMQLTKNIKILFTNYKDFYDVAAKSLYHTNVPFEIIDFCIYRGLRRLKLR